MWVGRGAEAYPLLVARVLVVRVLVARALVARVLVASSPPGPISLTNFLDQALAQCCTN